MLRLIFTVHVAIIQVSPLGHFLDHLSYRLLIGLEILNQACVFYPCWAVTGILFFIWTQEHYLFSWEVFVDIFFSAGKVWIVRSERYDGLKFGASEFQAEDGLVVDNLQVILAHPNFMIITAVDEAGVVFGVIAHVLSLYRVA